MYRMNHISSDQMDQLIEDYEMPVHGQLSFRRCLMVIIASDFRDGQW
jgi:hypothetical protein